MAQVINGLLRGKLGKVVYRIIDGKQYASALPEKVNQPDTEEYRSRLHIFGLCCSLNAAIYKVRVFSESWKKSKLKTSKSLNKMFIINRSRLKPGYDISGIWLVDNFRFSAELNQHNFSGEDFAAVLTITVFPGLTQLVSLQGIVELLDPVHPAQKAYMFFPFISPDYPFTPGEDMAFLAKFTSQDIELMKTYSVKKILFNLAFKNMDGKVLGFSGNKYLG